MNPGRFPAASKLALALLAAASLASPAYAGTQLIDFEGLADSTPVTTQYQNLGVTFIGMTASVCGVSLDCNTTPPSSGVTAVINDFFSGGVTRVDFSTLAGRVMSVSVRITGASVIYLEAYNAAGTLLGSAQTAGANYIGVGTPNALLSMSTATDQIAYVLIHDGGSSFVMDDFAFTVPDVLPVSFLADAILAIPDTAYVKKPAASRGELLHKVAELEKVIRENKPVTVIRKKILELRKAVLKLVKPGPEQTAVLNAITQFSQQY